MLGEEFDGGGADGGDVESRMSWLGLAALQSVQPPRLTSFAVRAMSLSVLSTASTATISQVAAGEGLADEELADFGEEGPGEIEVGLDVGGRFGFGHEAGGGEGIGHEVSPRRWLVMRRRRARRRRRGAWRRCVCRV